MQGKRVQLLPAVYHQQLAYLNQGVTMCLTKLVVYTTLEQSENSRARPFGAVFRDSRKQQNDLDLSYVYCFHSPPGRFESLLRAF